MPLIHVNVPEGALDREIEQELYKRLGPAVLEVEGGPDTPEARSITWMFINEVKPGAWAIGGDSDAVDGSVRLLIYVTVPQGSLNVDRKALMAERVNEVIVDVIGQEAGVPNSCVIINEVPEGSWGVGGIIVGFADIARFAGVDPKSERGREIFATFSENEHIKEPA